MFQAVMHEASQGRFDVLIVWKLDRFSGTLLRAVQIKAKLQKNEAAPYNITEPIDTTTSAGCSISGSGECSITRPGHDQIFIGPNRLS